MSGLSSGWIGLEHKVTPEQLKLLAGVGVGGATDDVGAPTSVHID